jgi:hypothetical protein
MEEIDTAASGSDQRNTATREIANRRLRNKIQSQTFGIIRDLGIKPKSTSKTTTSIYSNAPPRPTPVGNSGREAIGVDRSLAVDSEYCRLAREVERGK